MGDEPAALDRETEVVRSVLSPGRKGVCRRKVIEAIVDFHRIEVSDIELQHAR